jgi:hypothetical protein
VASIGIGVKPLSGLIAPGFLAIPNWIFFIQDIHELRRIEHLATHLALHKLDVLLAGDDANLRMFA